MCRCVNIFGISYTVELRKEDIDLGDFENDTDNNSQNNYENRKKQKNLTFKLIMTLIVI